MRKRELEKLLYKTVADALGVEIDARRNTHVEHMNLRKPPKPRASASPQQHAA